MLADYQQIVIAAVLCWVLFVTVDIAFRLPETGGVSGATAIGRSVEEHGGALAGGTMMGNIVSSPDASAGTLLAACGVYVAGLPGGLAAAVLVFIGNRICHDPGYAGTTGAVLASLMVAGLAGIGFAPENFIAGMVVAILTIQGLSHRHASRLLARIWGWRS
jgi:energy-converting hydrogenase A subunit B